VQACGEEGDGNEVIEVEVRHSNVQLLATATNLRMSAHIFADLKSKPCFGVLSLRRALRDLRDEF
jgi:hypothetical protein